MTAKTAIPLPLEQLAEICRRYGIVRLEVFGSILRDDFGPESDIDFMYTKAPDAPKWHSSWLVYDIEKELEELLGRRVDLLERKSVEVMDNPYRRKGILTGAEVLLEFAQAA